MCTGDKCSSDPNYGYDDSRGDYLTVVRPCCCRPLLLSTLDGSAAATMHCMASAGQALGSALSSASVCQGPALREELIGALPPNPVQVGDHISFRYEVLGTLGRGSFGQARVQ